MSECGRLRPRRTWTDVQRFWCTLQQDLVDVEATYHSKEPNGLPKLGPKSEVYYVGRALYAGTSVQSLARPEGLSHVPNDPAN
jgi:hypothetical protein